MAQANLRDRLRQETRAAHDAVDAAFDAFDLARPDQLAAFLRAQGAGLAALGARTAAACADIAEDLSRLGADAARAADAPDADHPLARAYLWEGSRMGIAVLAGRARRAGVECRYLSQPGDPSSWRALCADLSARSADGPEADRIVAAARAWFAVFEDAAQAERARVDA